MQLLLAPSAATDLSCVSGTSHDCCAAVQATTPGEMYRAIGIDCWIIVPIRSLCRENATLEGTRLTITKSKDQPDGHEFSIRTPVTPSRWKEFDQELEAAFEAICSAALADGALLHHESSLL